jgi:hypothetical protein
MTPMRATAFFCMVGAALWLPLSGAPAQEVYRGNDTGGIIPWSCAIEPWAPRIAAEHCAQFNKYFRITGVQRHLGDYISFACLWAPNIEPFIKPPVALHRVACATERPLSVRN